MLALNKWFMLLLQKLDTKFGDDFFFFLSLFFFFFLTGLFESV